MNIDTTAASGWTCRRCGQHMGYGQTHVCYGYGSEDTIMYSPSTELSLEDRVAKLETYVADLRSAVEELIKAMPVG